MSIKSLTSTLVQRNKEIAATHKPLPDFPEIVSMNLTPPKLLIITCVDPRNVPEKYLGLQGIEAGVLRNVCGHVGPAINHIVALDHLLGYEEIMIIHHTDCGALRFTDADVRATLKARAPGDESIDGMDFGAISDVEQSVRDDLAVLKASPLVKKELKDGASGWVFDIKTGLLSAVGEE